MYRKVVFLLLFCTAAFDCYAQAAAFTRHHIRLLQRKALLTSVPIKPKLNPCWNASDELFPGKNLARSILRGELPVYFVDSELIPRQLSVSDVKKMCDRYLCDLCFDPITGKETATDTDKLAGDILYHEYLCFLEKWSYTGEKTTIKIEAVRLPCFQFDLWVSYSDILPYFVKYARRNPLDNIFLQLWVDYFDDNESPIQRSK